jgi:hypothetical protein
MARTVEGYRGPIKPSQILGAERSFPLLEGAKLNPYQKLIMVAGIIRVVCLDDNVWRKVKLDELKREINKIPGYKEHIEVCWEGLLMMVSEGLIVIDIGGIELTEELIRLLPLAEGVVLEQM